MEVSVIVPTFNEAPNVRELVKRIQIALRGRVAEIVFVDDSNDDTPTVIGQVAAEAEIPVRLIRRDHPVGGLSGAVLVGLAASTSDWCIVMDGDLQHPPEVIPVLLSSGIDQDADIAVASRHVNGGSSEGLSGWLRHLVSASATVLVRAMFPTRLRNCTDPMTGFFAIRRSAVDFDSLRPRGFKILLEILARNTITVIEEPFVIGHRHAGESKADIRQGLRFLTQLASLRFGRLSGFALSRIPRRRAAEPGSPRCRKRDRVDDQLSVVPGGDHPHSAHAVRLPPGRASLAGERVRHHDSGRGRVALQRGIQTTRGTAPAGRPPSAKPPPPFGWFR